MSDTLITIIAIALAAVLMFVFPLMTMSDRTDDVAQLTVETATTEFVDTARSTGKITKANYDKFIDKIGENVYYSVYTSQIEEAINSKNAAYFCKEGDIVSASVKNTNQTISQQLKNFFYTVTGNDSYTIAAEHAGVVTANGK